MARAKEDATASADTDAGDAAETGTALENIEAAFADVPEDATVTLYRRQPDTGKWGLLDQFAPELFNVKLVADKWGGGIYNALATGRVKGKPGRPRLANVQFTVDPKVSKGPNGDSSAVAGSTKLNDVLEASYVQALSSMMQTMQATAEAARRPGPDWPTIMAAVSPVLVALLERKGDDPLKIAAKLVELTRPDGKAPEFKELFDVFTQGLEFGAESKPDGLSKIAETVTQLVERTSHEEGRRMLPGDTQAPPEAPAESEGPPWLQVLRPFFPYLTKMATAGKDPALYSEWLVDQLSPEAVAAISVLAKDAGFPDNVIAVLPAELAQLRPWYHALCLEVSCVLDKLNAFEPEPESPISQVKGFARPPVPRSVGVDGDDGVYEEADGLEDEN